MNQDIGFVLLHGAGLGAWIWQDTVSRIDAPCLAIDLPGRGGQGSRMTASDYSLQQYVDAVLAEIDGFKPQKLILVCHSISGVIGLEIAGMRRERIAGFIAVGAAIPAANGSFLSCLPGVQGMFMRLMLTLAGTKPPAAAIRSGLCSDLDEAIAAKVVESFVPESKRLYMDKRRHSELPRNALYVQLKQDREFNAGMQQRMVANLQAAQAAEMDSGHLPMLSKPDELARICMQYADAASKPTVSAAVELDS